MSLIATVHYSVYSWMPRWFLVMMLVSSAGSTLLFLLTIRVSGKKGFLLLALAAALPCLLFAKAKIDRMIEEASIRRQYGEVYFDDQGGPRPEVPWMSVLTFAGALLIYRSEKKQANHPTEPHSPSLGGSS
jgi:hypothetical protein